MSITLDYYEFYLYSLRMDCNAITIIIYRVYKMVKRRYKCDVSNIFYFIIIINTNVDAVDEITPESFTNSPLKLKTLKAEAPSFKDFCYRCFVEHALNNSAFDNMPFENYVQILRSELPR